MLNSRRTCSPQCLNTGQQAEVCPVLLAFVCYDLTGGGQRLMVDVDLCILSSKLGAEGDFG